MTKCVEGYCWNEFKNAWLKAVRGVSFEEILTCRVIKVRHSRTKSNQAMLLLERNGYIWVAPYVQTSDGIFLKTLYASRQLTKQYKRGFL